MAAPHGVSDREFIAFLASTSALIALAIDTLLPAFPEIRAAFGRPPDDTSVSWTITVFFLGIALGQLAWGPISDHLGRKPTLIASFVVLSLGSIGAMMAPSFTLFLVGRAISGLGAAGARVGAQAMTRDCYQGDRMARISSFVMAVFLLAPVVGPALGEGLLRIGTWRWTIGISVVASLVIMAWLGRINETLPAARRRGLRFAPLASAAQEVVANRFARACVVAQIVLYGAFLPWLGSSELMIGEIYDRSSQFALLFGGSAAFMGMCIAISGSVVERVGAMRMIVVVLGITVALSAVATVISLASDGLPSFWVFFGLAALVVSLNSVVSPLLQSQTMLPFGHIAGMASAISGAASMAIGALLGRLTDARIDGSVTPFFAGFLIFSFAGWVAVLLAQRSERRGREGHRPGASLAT